MTITFASFSVPTLNTYRTPVSPTLDLLCHEDFNVGRSEADLAIKKVHGGPTVRNWPPLSCVKLE